MGGIQYWEELKPVAMLADIEQGYHMLETSQLVMQQENFKVCLCMCVCGGVHTCYSAHVDVRAQPQVLVLTFRLVFLL